MPKKILRINLSIRVIISLILSSYLIFLNPRIKSNFSLNFQNLLKSEVKNWLSVSVWKIYLASVFIAYLYPLKIAGPWPEFFCLIIFNLLFLIFLIILRVLSLDPSSITIMIDFIFLETFNQSLITFAIISSSLKTGITNAKSRDFIILI